MQGGNYPANYRISELEKKVDRHNALVERTTIVERDLKAAWREIDELREGRK